MWKRLAYVAITRAQERLIWVVRNRLAKPTYPLRVDDLRSDTGGGADIGGGGDMSSIIVTGASSGIGRATAELFLDPGLDGGFAGPQCRQVAPKRAGSDRKRRRSRWSQM